MAKGKSSIVTWDEELAKMAEVAAGMVAGIGGGKFISTKGGVLAVNGAPVPGNRMGVVVLDSVLENAFYENEFDPDNPAPPVCYAFGRDPTAMAPHVQVVEAGTAVNEQCRGCPKNEFGSADKGRGKACKNVARLALIPAGQFVGLSDKFKLTDDPDYYGKGETYVLKVPVTSVAGFAAFTKQVKEAMKLPLAGIVTKIACVPDPKSQYKVTFEAVQQLPKSLLPSVIARYKEVTTTIDAPYPPPSDDAPAPRRGKKAKGNAGARPRY